MGKLRTGKNIQAGYKLENRYMRNKRVKIERHLREHPDDATAKAALSNIVEYRRKKPHNSVWSSVTVNYARQLKMTGVKGKELTKTIFRNQNVK